MLAIEPCDDRGARTCEVRRTPIRRTLQDSIAPRPKVPDCLLSLHSRASGKSRRHREETRRSERAVGRDLKAFEPVREEMIVSCALGEASTSLGDLMILKG